MAKLPRYLTKQQQKSPTSISRGSSQLKCNDNYQFSLVIKRWGIPILIYKALKEYYELKWYQWLLYPYLCFKLMRGNNNECKI